MTLARAIAYTSRPHETFEWKAEIVIADSANGGGIKLDESPDPLRRRYRGSVIYNTQIINRRRRILFDSTFNTTDKNRITNSIIAYSNGFHSESPATQLTTVWSSLEGLLPPSTDGEGRIVTILKFALPCQQALYIRNLFQWSFIEHYSLGKDAFFNIIDKVTEFKDRMSRFVSILCFPEYSSISNELGSFAFRSPLTTYRGSKLVSAATKTSALWKLIENHQTKIDWQIRRIYRERNRIIHQASPSSNVTTIILNLNEYFLSCLETLFDAISTNNGGRSIDNIFSQISIDQMHRKSQVISLRNTPVNRANANLVLGFPLL